MSICRYAVCHDDPEQLNSTAELLPEPQDGTWINQNSQNDMCATLQSMFWFVSLDYWQQIASGDNKAGSTKPKLRMQARTANCKPRSWKPRTTRT
eukprot:CAMPEP_0114325054 /NCGR_PEP_ID=MMETSP0059-20121206/28881_1 /TAXON_ID=36894 /ORGANISM="Pyramimonas parkeae, Strain CCMP726" /LENGTH=94 /DNA_ID=CAMNT_0001453725 /DNA_START=9 /DNA_END=289 /DNA_ORIENTATION=+